MKPGSIARMISIILFGVLLGCAVHFGHVKRGRMTREGFLVKQGERFDRHFAKPDPIVIEVLVCAFITGIVFGAYELVAFGLSRALGGAGDDRNG